VDVLTLLHKDHETVGSLLDQALKLEPDDDKLHDLAKQIEQALTVHAAIEEKYFYPILQKRAEETEETVDVFEAYTEHDLIKRLIALLQSGRQPDEKFKAEVQVLSENVKHHVKEEESTIFSLARDLMEIEEREDLGAKMERAKNRMLNAQESTSKKPAPKKAPARKSTTRKAPARKAPARKKARR
jgi:hemerythrin superfamily protein